jgi:hypothetical protein
MTFPNIGWAASIAKSRLCKRTEFSRPVRTFITREPMKLSVGNGGGRFRTRWLHGRCK